MPTLVTSPMGVNPGIMLPQYQYAHPMAMQKIATQNNASSTAATQIVAKNDPNAKCCVIL